MVSLLAFLNTDLGLLLVGALIGAIGLFTWQRQDWIFKQAYLRSQVMLDRRLRVIEALNSDLGALLASANGVIAVWTKDFEAAQRDKVVSTYNERQAAWFGAAPTHAAILGFYLRPRTSERFTAMLEETQRLDQMLYRLTVGDASADEAHEVAESVHGRLREWNDSAMKQLSTI